MVVRAAGYDVDPTVHKSCTEGIRILPDLLHIGLERGLKGLLKADSLGCDHVLQGAALGPGEHSLVEVVFLRGLFHGKDQAASGAAQSLVGRGRHNIGIGEGTRMKTGRHKACDVRNISHQDSAAGIGSFAEFFEINSPSVGGGTGDDHFGFCLGSELYESVIVNKAVLIYTVGDNIVIGTGNIGGTSMSEVAALIEVHSHQGISGFEDRELYGEVGGGAGMGLYICISAAEKLLCALDSNGLDDIDDLAAAIIPFAGIAFCIFVGKRASHCSHHRFAGPVLRCDQFNMLVLTLYFLFNGSRDLRIDLSDFFD